MSVEVVMMMIREVINGEGGSVDVCQGRRRLGVKLATECGC